jgi:hypothetical protein
MTAGWWESGQACERCGITFCRPHHPGALHRRVWVGPAPTAYHTSPWCAATPAGVRSRAAGAEVVRLDLEGGGLDGVPVHGAGVPAGWRQVGETEAVARGLGACLRC